MRSQIVDITPTTQAESVQRHADGSLGEVEKPDPTPPRQDAFGDEEHAEVKYNVLTWRQGGLLMVAETISLGILSLPAAIASLGLIPGLIVLIGLGVLAYAGEILIGRFGRELFGTGQLLFLIFIMASHILTFTVALNTITGIFSAIMIAMIALGIQNKGSILQPTVETNLVTEFTAATNIAFSQPQHIFYLYGRAQRPKRLPKALALLQTIDKTLYIIAGVVIYRYAGADVTSPALGSAGPLISRIAYGVALPTVRPPWMAPHVAANSIYIRIFAGSDRMHKRDFVAIGSWVGLAVCLWIVAWIIAEAIPVFSSLLSLITALFGSWFTFGVTGMFWLHMNKGLWFSLPKKIAVTLLNAFAICVGIVLCGLGLCTSGKSIHVNPGSSSFSCANAA
ncbi:Amino acid transporter transmembrane [Penicillium subrubescens]|uniref:Amino acid transporter transmembrane n=1 Tax=Penicillium subrubescens TaxID=1316194 RepID=UPI00254551E5|nr:Amino acid transporter transmembrane [Penicillium subrubescens]KAJ5896233.1 Amino acid transporter transmembrane [Penicillium subrubescens]